LKANEKLHHIFEELLWTDSNWKHRILLQRSYTYEFINLQPTIFIP